MLPRQLEQVISANCVCQQSARWISAVVFGARLTGSMNDKVYFLIFTALPKFNRSTDILDQQTEILARQQMRKTLLRLLTIPDQANDSAISPSDLVQVEQSLNHICGQKPV